MKILSSISTMRFPLSMRLPDISILSSFFVAASTRTKNHNGVKNNEGRSTVSALRSDIACHIFKLCFYYQDHFKWQDQVVDG